MDLSALGSCVSQVSCVVTQTTSGLISGMLLFLVSCGLTLIFGVLGVVNFAHGSLYMLGAFFAYTVYVPTHSFALAILAGAVGTGLFGIVFERFFISRVYGSDVLMQLLVCYAFVLILDDVVKMVWGASYLSMGMPEAFMVPPLFIAGGVVPPFYLFLIGISALFGLALWLLMARTRFGKVVRAAAQNGDMVAALGIRTPYVFAAVFALGSVMAGAAGALAAPVRSLTAGMGFSVLIESFIVTVIGGMGSIVGALVASILLGLIQSFGAIGFPLFTDGLMFTFMAVVLIVKPTGLFGQRVR
ncbi:MAG: branched-chain amino acid ABC transporter permease [Rhodospirillales bacterium]|nr:branched-chain amino acid ABC transporter permease [Rhodospirillales bacterium]